MRVGSQCYIHVYFNINIFKPVTLLSRNEFCFSVSTYVTFDKLLQTRDLEYGGGAAVGGAKLHKMSISI